FAGVWIPLGAVVVIVAGMIGLAAITRLGPRAATSPGALLAPRRISTFATARMACPTSAAFSPDGTRILVLGTLGACAPTEAAPSRATATPAPHAAALYESASGRLLKLIRLEPLLGLGAAATPGAPSAGAVSFFGLGWSPDGTSAAFAYTAFDATARLTADHVLDSGLLLLDLTRGGGTIIHGDSGFFAPLGGGGGGFPIWHIAQGTETPTFTPLPGLTYTWGHGSQPAPIKVIRGALAQLPIDAGPRYPVGDPAGGATFSIWQPGLLVGPGRTTLGGGRAVFLTAFSSWSPDSAQVTLMTAGAALPLAADERADDPAATPGDLALPLPTPAILARAPARDTALDAVRRQIGGDGWALVAWNPLGTLLASVTCQDTSTATLALRETGSRLVASAVSLPLSGSGEQGTCASAVSAMSGPPTGAYPSAPLALLWSPRGDRLLVRDRAAGTITLWPVSAG
ncbi:MAG: hypothetical protein IVW57_01660, partial [Ktedonobacterales bacterium]|nr:hypothetical protein [Ktedonobacterales bacterium]